MKFFCSVRVKQQQLLMRVFFFDFLLLHGGVARDPKLEDYVGGEKSIQHVAGGSVSGKTTSNHLTDVMRHKDGHTLFSTDAPPGKDIGGSKPKASGEKTNDRSRLSALSALLYHSNKP